MAYSPKSGDRVTVSVTGIVRTKHEVEASLGNAELRVLASDLIIEPDNGSGRQFHALDAATAEVTLEEPVATPGQVWKDTIGGKWFIVNPGSGRMMRAVPEEGENYLEIPSGSRVPKTLGLELVYQP